MSDDLRELVARILIVMVVVTWGVILWRGERNNAMPNFGFRNLISTRDGFPDRVAIMELGAFVAMTAVVIIAALRNSTDLSALCGWYVSAFTLRGAAAAVTHAMNPVAPGIKKTTVDSSTVTTSTVTPAATTEDQPLPKGAPTIP